MQYWTSQRILKELRLCKEWKSSKRIFARNDEFNYYDTCGHYYEGIGRVEIGTLARNPK
jgi:hypothetical protein